jgi:hypothetical protein
MNLFEEHEFTINKNIYSIRVWKWKSHELRVNGVSLFDSYMSSDNFLSQFNLAITSNKLDYFITLKKEELLSVYDYLYNYFKPLEVRRVKLEKIMQKIISK